MWPLAVGAAWAFTPAGYGVPEVGGAFAGASEDGAAGLFFNPAAARPERGEALLDLGWLYTDVRYQLATDPPFALRSEGGSVVPTLAVAEPLGPVGIGLAVFPLYSRGGGAPSPEDGAQRFHTISGGIQVFEGNLQVAARLHRAWTVGVGLRGAYCELSSVRAIDSGALLENLAGPGTGLPIGDTFLEGRQSLPSATGWGVGANVGVRFTPEHGPWVTAAFRSPMRAVVRGPLTLTPSTSLDMELSATATTTLPLPPAAFVAMDIAVGRARIVPEASWIGWGAYYHYDTELTDISVASGDPYVEALLDAYGVSEADFLQGAAATTSYTGAHDTFNAGLSAFLPLGPTVTGRVGAWYAMAAVPDEVVHPGNLDFTTVDARLAVAWAPWDWLDVGLAGDWFVAPDRVVTTSLHAMVDPTPPGSPVPSGAGTYALTLARVGLDVRVRHDALIRGRRR